MKKSRLICTLISISAVFLLCSCKSTPTNNSHMDEKVKSNSSSHEITYGTISTMDSGNLNYQDTFQSSDKSINFEFDIQDNIAQTRMPIVEVAPHFLTEDDAKRISEVLFEGAVCYDAQPSFATVYSKEEIRAKIARWSQYVSDESIEKLFGSPQINAANVVRDFIGDYTQLLENAPDKKAETPCTWVYKESWRYSYSESQVKEENIPVSMDDMICAEVYYNDIPYRYTVTTRNKSDYKYNMIYAVVDYGMSPWNVDDMILQEKLCRNIVPSQEQIEHVSHKAYGLLCKMGIGEWQVDCCEVQQIKRGDAIDYQINVKAVPMFNGSPAIRMPQLSNLKSKENYASNYYLTDANFTFAPDGTLISFQLFSPIDIIGVIAENSKIQSIDSLMEIAKKHFTLSDAYNYGIGGTLDESDQKVECNIVINKLKYGLARVKVIDADDRYYYVPSILLLGNVEYSLANTGETCFYRESASLLHINAIDGSIIPMDN